MVIKFVENGLIHGDYNEFNLITNDQGTELTVIDFPQCISVNHPNADAYFNRDVECIYTFFDKMVKRELN
jgi:RIO kinase 2